MIPIQRIERAREAIPSWATRTPLMRLDAPEADLEIFLKLESLQPIGSFKIRGAASVFASLPDADLAEGVLTASAGNWAQGLAWAARAAGVPCTIVVPESAPRTKLAAIERLGARYVSVSFDRWWQCMTERRFEGVSGRFVHPVEDEAVMAGNGTIGLELLEDLPDVEAVVVPWGGGGLASGIASALAQRAPRVKVYAAEVATAAPLGASLAAGERVEVERKPSFVDGIGSSRLLPAMWPLAQELLAGAFAAPVEEVARAVRLLVERSRVVAEGAGATPVAVALSGRVPARRVACIVSGGNIDLDVLAKLLSAAPGDERRE